MHSLAMHQFAQNMSKLDERNQFCCSKKEVGNFSVCAPQYVTHPLVTEQVSLLAQGLFGLLRKSGSSPFVPPPPPPPRV